MSAPNEIILYHDPFSPFARRVAWYFALRGIQHARCLQPVTLPRPDLEQLSVSYRRIPVLAHRGSIYCDTRLILKHLVSAFPGSHLTVPADQEPVRQLLENWTIDGGIFARAAQVLPPDLPMLEDNNFRKDRKQYTSRIWSKKSIRALRPEALAHIRQAFNFIEHGFLIDGRRWILDTAGPSLADIEGIWPFHWMIGLKVALPEHIFSPATFPKVFSWVDRFDRAVREATERLGEVPKISGEGARLALTKMPVEAEKSKDTVDENDPTGLKAA